MRLLCVLYFLTALVGLLPAETGGGPEGGSMEALRLEAVRQSLVSRWSATVGRENIYLTFREDGTARLGDREGTWLIAGPRLELIIEESAINYRYEIQENFLTLSEGDLTQPLRFTRMGTGAGLVEGYRAWFGLAYWKKVEARVYRVASILAIVLVAVLLIRVLRGVSQFLIFTDWGPLGYIYRRNKSRTRTIHSVTLNILKYLIFFTALGHILNELGINYTTYIASLSVIGLAVGFGSQGLVQDIVTGFFLLFDGQFSVGDMVEISGQTGIVEEMGLRTTRLRNYIGQSVVIPNRNIALVGNYTKGCLEAYTDIAVMGDRSTSELRKRLTLLAAELFRQYEGTILAEPKNLGTLRLQTGEAFIRLRFRLWPQQQAFFDQQIVPRIREFLGREGVENPASRVAVFFRHPEPLPTSSWRFLRRREREGQAPAIGPESVATAPQAAASATDNSPEKKAPPKAD